MPGNPNQCKALAFRCMQLADAAQDAAVSQKFLQMAELWTQLAAELQAFRPLVKAIEERKPLAKRGGFDFSGTAPPSPELVHHRSGGQSG